MNWYQDPTQQEEDLSSQPLLAQVGPLRGRLRRSQAGDLTRLRASQGGQTTPPLPLPLALLSLARSFYLC